MTRPAVSATAEDLYAALGAWSAFDGEESGWVALHLCEALVGPGRLDDINVLCRDAPPGPPIPVADGPDEGGTIGEVPIGFAPLGDSDAFMSPPIWPNHPGWSVLMDIDQTPDIAVPWLAQTVGAHADPDLSTITNRRLIKSTPTWQRGKLKAIVAAAKLYLTGPQLVEVHERDTSAYHATVRLYADQVAGATYAELQVQYPTIPQFEAAFDRYSDIPSTGRVAQRILSVKPAGIVLDIVLAARASYAAIQRIYPTIPGFEAALPTYPACASYRPPVDIYTIGA